MSMRALARGSVVVAAIVAWTAAVLVVVGLLVGFQSDPCSRLVGWQMTSEPSSCRAFAELAPLRAAVFRALPLAVLYAFGCVVLGGIAWSATAGRGPSPRMPWPVRRATARVSLAVLAGAPLLAGAALVLGGEWISTRGPLPGPIPIIGTPGGLVAVVGAAVVAWLLAAAVTVALLWRVDPLLVGRVAAEVLAAGGVGAIAGFVAGAVIGGRLRAGGDLGALVGLLAAFTGFWLAGRVALRAGTADRATG